MIPDQDRGLAPASFDARVVLEDGRPVVVVQGEVDLATGEQFEAVLAQAVADGPRITVDLRDVTFLDSTGLVALVIAHNHLGQVPEAIVLRDAQPQVCKVLAISGIERFFTLETTRTTDTPPRQTEPR